MGILERRLEALEGRIGPPEDKGAELRRALKIDILSEISRLRSLRGHGIHRNDEPNIPPFDPVGEALGYPYTHGQFIEFAVRSVLERERDKAPEILAREVVEELIASWTESFRRMFMKVGVSNPDEIAEHGPPEPAPPYSGVRYRAMGLRDRLRRLERDAGDLSGTLKMPDGTEVSYQRSEMFDDLLATIDGREHRLLPYLREAEPDTNKRMPGLIRAIGGNEARGAQG